MNSSVGGAGGGGVGVAQGLALLDAAVIAMAVGIFEAQAHLWTIFLQVEQLLAVERSSTLLSDELDSIFIFHTTFDQGECHQNRSSPQPCHTVDSDAAAGLLPELQLQQVQPIIHDLVGGRSSVVKWPIQNLDSFFHHQGGIIGGLANSHDGGHSIFLQFLDKLVQGGVGGVVGNEEPHVFVGDLHRGWSVHTSHRDNVKKITKPKSLPQNKNTNVNTESNSEGMSNKNVQRASRNPETELLRSSFEVGEAIQKKWEIWGFSGQKKGGQSEKQLKTLSSGREQKKREKKKQGWFHLDSGQAEADEGSVQRVELPHPGRVVAGSGRRPGPANFPGIPPVAQVRRIDGEFGCSLVCIGGVLSLAVVPTALQKLHKCVTQNTTELWDMLTH